LDDSNPPFYRWYSDGLINMCYNAIDRHVEGGKGDSIAFIYDSAYTAVQNKITYKEAQNKVGRISSIM
jgi:propionyl-CoA synthetase